MLVQSRIFHQLSDLSEFLLNSGQIARLQVVAVPAGRSHAIHYLLHVGAKAGPLLRLGLPAGDEGGVHNGYVQAGEAAPQPGLNMRNPAAVLV